MNQHALGEIDRMVNGSDEELREALGMADIKEEDFRKGGSKEEAMTEQVYEVHPDPASERVDLSGIRGQMTAASAAVVEPAANEKGDTDLAALAEILPEVTQRRSVAQIDSPQSGSNSKLADDLEGDRVAEPATPALERMDDIHGKVEIDEDRGSTEARRLSMDVAPQNQESMNVHSSKETDTQLAPAVIDDGLPFQQVKDYDGAEDASFGDYVGSEACVSEEDEEEEEKIPKEFVNMSSGNSISTATQTHEVRMPMYLPTFKPATGCTNASDFIVRCFVARLRSGVTVVKHGRSRWCKSRLRVLHIHPDGRSLSWKPAEGEPNSSKRPPKLDLSTCLEVRHAWSPDPQNPMYTGTPILRQKCEAANAHKSFALIFKQRTVDITAVTADQCKVLMEGFSALCFRLQVASLAGGRGGQNKRPMPEEDGVSTTASATLTNTSTPRNR